MNLIPEEQLKTSIPISLAPMVDFLFVIVAIFATIAITRNMLNDADVNLVTISSEKKAPLPNEKNDQSYILNLGITPEGKYKWITPISQFLMDNIETVQQKLHKEQKLGLLSNNPEQTKILLHIDRNTKWECVAETIFTLREQGFPVHPVYQP